MLLFNIVALIRTAVAIKLGQVWICIVMIYFFDPILPGHFFVRGRRGKGGQNVAPPPLCISISIHAIQTELICCVKYPKFLFRWQPRVKYDVTSRQNDVIHYKKENTPSWISRFIQNLQNPKVYKDAKPVKMLEETLDKKNENLILKQKIKLKNTKCGLKPCQNMVVVETSSQVTHRNASR